MLRPNTVFCCHRNEIIARLKEDFGYETRLPLTGPIQLYLLLSVTCYYLLISRADPGGQRGHSPPAAYRSQYTYIHYSTH